MEDSRSRFTHILIDNAIVCSISCRLEGAAEGPNDIVRPSRSLGETNDGFDSFAHGKDVKISGEVLRVNDRFIEGVSRC